MVMASATGRRPSAATSPREAGRPRRGAAATEAGEAEAAHDRLVAYARALDAAHEPRAGVWVEHSYARAGLGGAGDGPVRVLLAHRDPPDPGDLVDVELADPPPPDPPLDAADSEPDDEPAGEPDDDDDDWEARLAAAAPGAEHLRLARDAADALRRVRLARLAGGRPAAAQARRDAARALRRALAPLWAGAAAGGARPPQWLHAALPALAPRAVRRDYERLVAEIRRAAPHLAERLPAEAPPDAPRALPPPGAGPAEGPWLVWVGPGRWPRLLGALVHTRVVAADAGAAAAPDAWCAAVAAAARVGIADVLAEAGSRAVVVGGAGAWATLAAGLAGGARAWLALGPAALTAEGEARLARPAAALLVAGGAAAASWRGALAETLGARRRLLLVAGADDALRLPPARARRLRLPQRALDALIAEECARWIREVCEAPEPEPEPAGARGLRSAADEPRRDSDEEEYAHLPSARPPLASGPDRRSIEIVEGRVVSRGSGATPLALMPPRREPRAERRAEHRAEHRAEPRRPLAAADIMHMPIVFADDERALDAQPESRPGPLTVRSGGGGGAAGEGEAGGVKYTRVIVAKRGAAGGRPLLLRRGVRLVPRDH